MFDEQLNIRAFRMLPRCGQVVELEWGTPLGVAVFRNFVAHYHAYADFYVALCTTLDGVDFTLVFKDGRYFNDMRDAIALSNLPKGMRGRTRTQLKKERQKEALEEIHAVRKNLPSEAELAARKAQLLANFDQAVQPGTAMMYFRSLSEDEQRLLLPQEAYLGMGGHRHYVASYYYMNDFFAAHCLTYAMVPFTLTFRGGCLAYDHMVHSLSRQKQR
jgi:hypothetical protein